MARGHPRRNPAAWTRGRPHAQIPAFLQFLKKRDENSRVVSCPFQAHRTSWNIPESPVPDDLSITVHGNILRPQLVLLCNNCRCPRRSWHREAALPPLTPQFSPSRPGLASRHVGTPPMSHAPQLSGVFLKSLVSLVLWVCEEPWTPLLLTTLQVILTHSQDRAALGVAEPLLATRLAFPLMLGWQHGYAGNTGWTNRTSLSPPPHRPLDGQAGKASPFQQMGSRCGPPALPPAPSPSLGLCP